MTPINSAQSAAVDAARTGPTLAEGVFYPHTYVWYVFVSSLDVMFTAVMLHFGGQEVNVIANWVLYRWDFTGMIVFKFVLVSLVICICEAVGRRNYRVGRELGHWAVGLTWIPVLLAALQLITEAPL